MRTNDNMNNKMDNATMVSDSFRPKQLLLRKRTVLTSNGFDRDAKSESCHRRTALVHLKMRTYAILLGACKRTRSANKRFPMRWPPKEIALASSGFGRDAKSDNCRLHTALVHLKIWREQNCNPKLLHGVNWCDNCVMSCNLCNPQIHHQGNLSFFIAP